MGNAGPMTLDELGLDTAGIAGLAGAAADALFYLDANARLIWANAAGERLFGRSLAESIGTDALEFIHPDDQQLVALSFLSMRGKDVGTLIEVRVRTPQGWRLVEVVGASWGDGVVLSVRDLTSRRRWEVASDEIERSRSILQNSSSITFLLNDRGEVLSSSGAVTRLLGVDQELIEGQPLSAIVCEDDTAQLNSALAELVSGEGRTATLDVRLRCGNGEDAPYALTFTDLLDDPIVEGIVATGHDVSDRVRSEAALREAVSVLAATLESTADGVLVVDSAGSITALNRRFTQMWGLETAADGSVDLHHMLERMSAQVTDPTAMAEAVYSLSDDRERERHDLFELVDGRAIEVDSIPQYVSGEMVGRVWTFRDVTEERRLREELSHRAFHDSLTGLANQALFNDRVVNAAARLERTGGELAVLFIDLDHFKAVNDRLGHAVGDELLVSISQRILGCLRAGDTAARVGGDEFAVLIDELDDRGDAVAVAERILGALSVAYPLSSGTLISGASIGIAYGDRTTNVDHLLRDADLAMYAAKAQGRNGLREFTEDLLHAAVDRIGLEADLGGAIDRGELELVYQPIVEMPARRVVAMEALVRWNHPERGVLTPTQFLQMVESTGRMSELGRFVLRRATSDAARWALGRSEQVAVCVNLSRDQLLDPELASMVSDALVESGLRPDRLVLEVAEDVAMADATQATNQMECLVGIGVRVAIDDFGTGATSLAHLAGFPIDMLKIDGEVLQGSLRENRHRVAEAVVMITASLGVIPVAEGVESVEQVDALLALGCHTMQGYHLCGPISRGDAVKLAQAGVLATPSVPEPLTPR